jgi:hypothetical protein
LLFVLLFTAGVFSAPYAQNGNLYVYQYQPSPPSWYVSSASYNTLYTYAYPSSPTATVRGYTQLYSFATSNAWLSITNGAVYSGASYDGDNYEYRLSLLQSLSAGTTTYTWSGSLFSFSANGSGTASLYAKISASQSSTSSYVYNVTLNLLLDGAQVYHLTAASSSGAASLSAGWGQASFTVPAGNHTLSAYVYISISIANPFGSTLGVTVELDKLQFSGYLVNLNDASVTLSPSSASQQGLQVSATYTATLSSDVDAAKVLSISPAPASYTYSYSKPTLTVTALYDAQSQSLATGTVSLPKPSGYTVLQYIARAPQGYFIVTNSSTPEYLDEAYAPGSASVLQVTLVQPSWKAVYTLSSAYTVTVYDSMLANKGSVSLGSGSYLFLTTGIDPADKCFLQVGSTLLLSARALNNTNPLAAQYSLDLSGTVTVSLVKTVNNVASLSLSRFAVAKGLSLTSTYWGFLVYNLANVYAPLLLDPSLSQIASLPTGSGYQVILFPSDPVTSDPSQWYLKLNSTLLYSAQSLNNTTLNPPQSGTTSITFTVQDYGFGYQVLQAFNLQSQVAASNFITSLGQVVLNLTPYASYLLQVCKTGVCKAVGLVTISSSNIQLTVMPSVPSVKPPSWVSASYDYTNKQLVVNVSCTSPPCTINIKKILANGTQTAFASLTCNTQLCGYAISAQDPFFTVTATDSSGKAAQASTGLSVPLWNSPLGSVVGTLGKTMNLDAFSVNINDFVILLLGLAVIYAAFTYRNWELALIVYGVWLTIGTLLLGGSGKLMVPGISLALVGAALSYMLKREQQP